MRLHHGSKALLIVPMLMTVSMPAPVRAQESSDPTRWQPFITDKDGKVKPLPEDPAELSKLKDKDWLAIRYSDFKGPKIRIAVVVSEDKQFSDQTYDNEFLRFFQSMSQEKEGADLTPANHIEDLVRQSLRATNRFTMLERTTALDDAIDEQDFGQSGRVEGNTKARIGKIKGAAYIVKTTVIEIDPEKDAKKITAVGGALTGGGIFGGGIGVKGTVAFSRLNVRVFHSETTEFVEDVTVDGTATSTEADVGGGAFGIGKDLLGGAGVKGQSESQAPISDAMQVAANKAAYVVARTFERLGDTVVAWAGAVASVGDSGELTVNGGTNVGLGNDMTLAVYSKGDEIKDPETGESLGFETREIGTVRVGMVAEKFAKCVVSVGCEEVKTGDFVKLMAAPLRRR